MGRKDRYLKCAVAAFFFATPIVAETDELAALLEGLKSADASTATQIEKRIFEIWSRSGSASMDLLLSRGREALEEGDTILAIRHFSALIDHAPEFAEGYNRRATAYFQEGRLGLSLEDIRRTLELNPQHFSAMTGLALIMEELGFPDEALSTWREIERFHPNSDGLSESMTRLERKVEGASL
ncbi:MAG: hypothetical protein AAF718_13735 [Pseudomonadota bacterium]